ncbi:MULTISPECIES: hypothetical protein [Acetobacter]|uniref:hypothetical protein n=1 Tax=Acetobacter TaxID=434 RepID=UPI0003151585|nr:MULTISPECIES: hypothetical protein [Acetobacter]ATI12613.1 hypothetical protein CPF11_09240 [Acetobacter pomorum]AXC27249.1 hypothetical protein DS739_11170 [Acetobacter sp. JWB]KAA8421854.1 hypothetical protein FKW54_12435 [Acetobacter pomorum]KAA8435594.1 hypothetical protein FKW50_06525 [Acetobacter pomorum]KAA8450939.1 hypothetical protein FKW52_09525 [Acetobacter pomorum]
MIPHAKMRELAKRYEGRTDLVQLWAVGENYKLHEITVFQELVAAAFYVHTSPDCLYPANRESGVASLCEAARDFTPAPTSDELAGFLLEATPIFDLHTAFCAFDDLACHAPAAMNRCLPIATALTRFRLYLEADAHARKTLKWLDTLPWSRLFDQAMQMDDAAVALLGERAFFGDDCEIIAIPWEDVSHAAA